VRSSAIQPLWYVHSSSNHYSTFTSHSTFNQCGHLSYKCPRVTGERIIMVRWRMNIPWRLYSRWPLIKSGVTDERIMMVVWQMTTLIKSGVTTRSSAMQPSWYVHSASNHYSTFISHSTCNQCDNQSKSGMTDERTMTVGWLMNISWWLYDKYWWKVEWLMNVIGQLYDRFICYTTALVCSSVTPLLISVVICHTTVMVCSSVIQLWQLNDWWTYHDGCMTNTDEKWSDWWM
jgi:hypothetical protein